MKGCTIYGVTVWRDCPAGNDVAQIVSARRGIGDGILFSPNGLNHLNWTVGLSNMPCVGLPIACPQECAPTQGSIATLQGII